GCQAIRTGEAMYPRRSPGFRRGLQHQVVDVAPAPVLAGLEAAHERVLRVVEVLGRVLAFGAVAAADVAAAQAHPQVDPLRLRLQAFLAALGRARLDLAHLIEVRALRGHRLAFVAFHYSRGTRVRLGGIAAEFAQRPALPQQIPALVELGLDVGKSLALV